MTTKQRSEEMQSVASDLTTTIQGFRKMLRYSPSRLKQRIEASLQRTIRMADEWDSICDRWPELDNTRECLEAMEGFQATVNNEKAEWAKLQALLSSCL